MADKDATKKIDHTTQVVKEFKTLRAAKCICFFLNFRLSTLSDLIPHPFLRVPDVLTAELKIESRASKPHGVWHALPVSYDPSGLRASSVGLRNESRCGCACKAR